MTADVIRIGLLGASKIAVPAIIGPVARMANNKSIEVAAVAARDPERAKTFAAEHGIPCVESDYAALVASEHVDLVYNGLPPSEHRQWSIAAMHAGKDVLCEKPFALNAAQAEDMVRTAKQTGRLLIEAFHYRFHPLFARVLEILHAGEIGAVKSLDSHFNVPIGYRQGELRYDKALGGGAMMDLGCYPLHWVRTVMAEEPEVVSATARLHDSGVDIETTAVLEFAHGVQAQIHCSMAEDLQGGLDSRLNIKGQRGQLTAVNPLAPHLGHELIVETGSDRRTEHIGGYTTYDHQLRHVVDVIRGKAEQITGGDDAIGNMCIIDEIYRLASGNESIINT